MLIVVMFDLLVIIEKEKRRLSLVLLNNYLNLNDLLALIKQFLVQ